MSSSNTWFEHPKSIDEIPEYLDQVFMHAEKNVWSKLLRGTLTKEWENKLAPKSKEKNDSEGDN